VVYYAILIHSSHEFDSRTEYYVKKRLKNTVKKDLKIAALGSYSGLLCDSYTFVTRVRFSY
jgi:hypothetical protein